MHQVPSRRSLLFVLALLAFAVPSFAQVRISVSFGPPALPVYEQPICPGEGYIWTPGYWAWDNDLDDYYWIPGTWILAPQPGFLWTPPYWGWVGGAYIFHEGYWGPHVGFYGGVVYGFGYTGFGYEGGRWQGDHFYYNRSVTNVNVVNIHNVYNENVHVTTVNRVSYNGGPGGIDARPRPEDEAAERERHVPPVAAQTQHYQEARSNPQLRASSNQGKPPIAATARPAEFREATPAKEAGAPYHPPANRGGGHPAGESAASHPPVHPNDLPPIQHPGPAGASQLAGDKKYQQQQQKLYAQQDKERQKLQQRQDQEHQKLEHQNANQAQKQQIEQRHQQQTQQLQQRHEQQQQRMQERQPPPPHKG
jgi:WXXGXW repeat (2 copies)